MKYLIYAVLCCMCLGSVQAQEAYFSVEEIPLAQSGKFPEFYSKKSKKGSERINQYLQLAMFQNLLNGNADTLKTNYTYKVLDNTEKMLSVVFLPKDTNAIASIMKRNFLFNAETGQLINLNDILTNNGLADIKNTVVRHQTDVLAKNRDTINAEEIKCIKNNIGEFELNRSYLKINSKDCFAHERLGEDSGIYPITLLPNGIYTHCLNQYGQALLSTGKKQKLRDFTGFGIGGMYTGKMNGEDVIVQMDPPRHQSLNAVVYNMETKKVIVLKGTFKNNRFELDDASGKLNLTISSGHAQGYWRAVDSKSYAPITLKKI